MSTEAKVMFFGNSDRPAAITREYHLYLDQPAWLA
jgi:hypothetical protein